MCGSLVVYHLESGPTQLGTLHCKDDRTYVGEIDRIDLPPGKYDIFVGQTTELSLLWGSGEVTITR